MGRAPEARKKSQKFIGVVNVKFQNLITLQKFKEIFLHEFGQNMRKIENSIRIEGVWGAEPSPFG